MKYIKKFEELDFSQTLPINTQSSLTNYYSCDECDNLWHEIGKESLKCKYCESDEIEDLPKDEWQELAKCRMTPMEYSSLLNEIEGNKNTDIDIYQYNSNKIINN